MYISLRKNDSGTISVLLFKSERLHGKKTPRSRLIKTFGSARDEKELKKLQEEAKRFKKQLEIENGTASRITLTSSEDIQLSTLVNRSFHDTYGKIYDMVFKDIPLSMSNGAIIKDLTLLRIASPCSKKKSSEICGDYGCSFTLDSAYKAMDRLDDSVIRSIKLSVKEYSDYYLKSVGSSVNVVFYDLTTIYFESNNKDVLREFGFSKDGKSQHVQITLALLVTTEGLPVGYEIFPGNVYEGHTLPHILSTLKDLYKMEEVVVVADSGLLNKKNISLLESEGYKYIIAARIKNESHKFQREILDQCGYCGISEGISSKVIDYGSGRKLISCYSEKKYKKDCHERESKLQKVMKIVGKNPKELLSSKYKKPYVKIEHGSRIVIDNEELEKSKRFDGYFGLITNCDKLPPRDIILQYKGLWQIERSFRLIKSNLSIRPVYHWKPERIKAHFAICYMAFALMRIMRFKLMMSGIQLSEDEVHRALDSAKSNIIKTKDKEVHIGTDLTNDLLLVYKVLRIKKPHKFRVV